jgi:hypothetical protein
VTARTLTDFEAEVIGELTMLGWQGGPLFPHSYYPARNNHDNASRQAINRLERKGFLERRRTPQSGDCFVVAEGGDLWRVYGDWLTSRGHS